MPRPKKNKKAALIAADAAAGASSATAAGSKSHYSNSSSEFKRIAETGTAKADLFDDDDEDGAESFGADKEVELKINDKFAARLEHNKKREEMQRLEAKYGKIQNLQSDDDSDSDSEEDVTEDEDGEFVTQDVDETLQTILSAIKSKDPRIYNTEQTWFKEQNESDKEEGEDGDKKKKEKPMTLKEYHVQNLLSGKAGDEDEEQESGRPGGAVNKSYQAEVDAAKKAFLDAAYGDGKKGGDKDSDDDNDDDDLLQEKPRRSSSAATKQSKPEMKKLTEEDVEKADEHPEEFLNQYFSTHGWVADKDNEGEDSAWAALESDSDTEDKLADQFEEAYNLRFEDPEKSSEMLRTHSRTVAALQSVRREAKLTKRQRARQKEKEAKAAAEAEAKAERARYRKLKIEETEKKVQVIKEAAGAKGREFDIKAWAKFLEGDYSDGEWDRMMAKEFGDGYYEDKDDGPVVKNRDEGAKKPVWDDDIDIGDLVGEEEAEEGQEVGDVELGDDDEEEGQDGDAAMADLDPPEGEDEDGDVDMDSSNQNKKLTKAEKASRKAAARAERRHIERIVDSQLATDHIFSLNGDGEPASSDFTATDPAGETKRNKKSAALAAYFLGGTKSSKFALPSQKAGLGHFKYRKTEPESFGLSALDILTATDEQLNEFTGLKRYAPFRDPKQKEKDKKSLNSKKVKQWRTEVFGSKDGVDEEVFAKAVEGKVPLGKIAEWREMEKKRSEKKAGKKRKREGGDGDGDGDGEKGKSEGKNKKSAPAKESKEESKSIAPATADGADGGEGNTKKRRKKKSLKSGSEEA